MILEGSVILNLYRRRIRKINYLLAIIFLFANCSFSSDLKEDVSELKGIKRKFMFKDFNYGVEIYLREDFLFTNFSYAYGCMGGYRVKIVLGEYKIDSNRISFIPQKLIWKENWEGSRDFTTTPIDTIDYYYSDSTKIQFNYLHIKKDKFEFLISEAAFDEQDEFFIKSSNFVAFANLYNANIEDKICSSVFCTIDTIVNIKNIFSKKDIPEKYRRFFFDETIEVTVKSVKVNKELYPIYQLTSDKVDDIFMGMKFYSKKYPNSPCAIIDKKEDILTAIGDNLFYSNTKLKTGTIVKSESWKTNE